MMSDLRYALRTLTAAPAFSLAAILTLALGTGANTAIFAAVYGVLLKPLPYERPDRLVRIGEARAGSRLNVSYPNFVDWRGRSRVFDDLAIYITIGNAAIAGANGPAEVFPAGNAEARLFRVLGIQAARGRLFTEADQEPAAPAVAVISDRLWRQRFGGDPSVAGSTVRIGDDPVTILGVLPPSGAFQQVDVWLPFRAKLLAPMQLNRANHPGFQVLARLRDGIDFDQAQREMASIAAALERQYPVANRDMAVILTPLLDAVAGSARATLRALFGAVSVLLLIACANVANLLLARGVRRERETSIRSALGATRGRLVRLFLIEGLVLGFCGGAAGMLLAAWGVRLLRVVPGFALPRAADIAIDPLVLGFAAALAALTAVLFSFAPALHLSRADVMRVLRLAWSADATTPRIARARSWLIGVEVALVIVLLAGAALMQRTLAVLGGLSPGFRAEGLMAVRLLQPTPGPDGQPEQVAHRLLDSLRGGPISQAAVSWPFDYTGSVWAPNITLPDRPFEEGREPAAQAASVSAGYFETMGIPIVRGRTFGAAEKAGAPVACVVSQSFADRFFPGVDPIGKRVSGVRIPQMQNMPIIGVVGDTRRGGMLKGVTPEIYVSYDQFPQTGATLVVRAVAGDPLALSTEVRARVASVEPGAAIVNMRRLSDTLAATYGDRRALAWLLAIFGGLSLGLTVLGIGSVVAFTVAERTAEIGIRMALGASADSVLGLVVRRALAPVALGAGTGLVALVPMARVTRQYVVGIGPADPVSIGAACLAVTLGALVAAYIPARRATRIDPLVSLRTQ